MERFKIKKNSHIREVIHLGLKQLGYEIIYQEVIKSHVIIYKNRQIHMAAVFNSMGNEDEFILVDYFKTHEIKKIAGEFTSSKDHQMARISETILNLKSIL